MLWAERLCMGIRKFRFQCSGSQELNCQQRRHQVSRYISAARIPAPVNAGKTPACHRFAFKESTGKSFYAHCTTTKFNYEKFTM